MGCGASTETKEIESKDQEDSGIKLLLLGAGASGKSTVFKQVHIIHNDGFSDNDRREFVPLVISNTLQAMKMVIEYKNTGDRLLEENKAHAAVVQDAASKEFEQKQDEAIPDEISKALRGLWADPEVQESYKDPNAFGAELATAKQFFPRIETILAEGYLPTDQDILHTRKATTGIKEMKFKIQGHPLRMVDVGGQRGERRYWKEAIKDVTALIFVASLAEYDQTLAEDPTMNRMKEALMLFDKCVNSAWFRTTSLILFLNKRDLFAEKVTKTDLKVCFPDYSGGLEYDSALQFITERFTERVRGTEKQVHMYVTCATDTNNIQNVFEALKEIILFSSLQSSGLM